MSLYNQKEHWKKRKEEMFCQTFIYLCPFISGTLHVGDEIREINGISVANQTVEQLQKMLVSLLWYILGTFSNLVICHA